ncbi:MAG: fibronectin type III domain-containing protein [Burkholderiales bacterium]|nr:fibronectin type III domain-containing protein [Burkholderiales bacterium]
MQRFISKPLSAAMLLALPLFCGTVQAVSFEDSPTPPFQTQSSGTGWKLVTVPTVSIGGEFQPPAAPLPPDGNGLAATDFTTVYMIDSIEGLNNAPLPAAIKQDLAGEFTVSLAARKQMAKTAGVNALGSSNLTPVIFVHKGVVEAMATGSEQKKYSAFRQNEAIQLAPSLFGCGGKWYGKSKSGSVNINNQSKAKNFNLTDGLSATLGADLPMNGKIDYTFNYSYRANSCIGIPYAVRFDNIHAKGDLNLNNSVISLTGSVTAQGKLWESPKTNLYSNTWTFFVGPIPVLLGLNVPYYFGVDANATLAGSISVSHAGTGVYSFDYTCTQSNCDGTNNSTVQFQNTATGSRAGVSVNVGVKPYAAIEANGYLYSEWFASAGIGTELSAPSSLWAYYGNNCGDADGDGNTEMLKSAVLDVNAQIALYGKWQIIGKKSWTWMDWKLSIPGWKTFKVSDYTKRDKAEFWALRRNLYFKELEPEATSALTPVIVGSSNPSASGTGYAAMMRNCVPFKDTMNYVIDWGDGTTSAVSGEPNQQVFQAHNWASTGTKTVKVMAVSDSIGRSYNNIATTRVVNVAPLAPPSAPSNISAPAQSGANLAISWGAASGVVQSYELQQQANGGAWTSVFNQNATSTNLNLALGSYNFRVRACNASGCGSFTNPITVNVVVVPSAPTLTVRADDLCSGDSTANWNAIAGANEYRVFRNTTNDSTTATLYQSTSATSASITVRQNTYLWVKACSNGACSNFSNAGTARITKGSACNCLMAGQPGAKGVQICR